MGRTPHPQAAASATGSFLGLAENGKTDAQQGHTDKHAKHRVSGHHVPHVADNGLDRAHIGKNAGYGSSGTGLRRILLSKESWLRGEGSNLHLQVESLTSYHYSHPAM